MKYALAGTAITHLSEWFFWGFFFLMACCSAPWQSAFSHRQRTTFNFLIACHGIRHGILWQEDHGGICIRRAAPYAVDASFVWPPPPISLHTNASIRRGQVRSWGGVSDPEVTFSQTAGQKCEGDIRLLSLLMSVSQLWVSFKTYTFASQRVKRAAWRLFLSTHKNMTHCITMLRRHTLPSVESFYCTGWWLCLTGQSQSQTPVCPDARRVFMKSFLCVRTEEGVSLARCLPDHQVSPAAPKNDSSHKQSLEEEQPRVTNTPERSSLLSNFHFWFNPSQPIAFGQSTRATWFNYFIQSVCVEPRGSQPAQRLRGTPGREYSLSAQLEENVLRGSNTQELEEAFH